MTPDIPTAQVKADRFRMLAWLWMCPSAGALVILVPGVPAWFQAASWWAGLQSVRFEQWIALGLLLLHGLFLRLSLYYRRTEAPRACPPFEKD